MFFLKHSKEICLTSIPDIAILPERGAYRFWIKPINELDLVYAPPVAPVYDPILIAASQAMKKVGR